MTLPTHRISPSGGIGRHARLKIVFHWSVGSSPTLGTRWGYVTRYHTLFGEWKVGFLPKIASTRSPTNLLKVLTIVRPT
jgi:hypothetical protein